METDRPAAIDRRPPPFLRRTKSAPPPVNRLSARSRTGASVLCDIVQLGRQVFFAIVAGIQLPDPSREKILPSIARAGHKWNLVGTPKTFAAADVQAAITRLTAAIAGRHQSAARKLIFLGVANGGIELAKRCADAFGARAGTLDISFHRDDIARHPIPKEFVPTRIPADVHGATVILVDDVLFSGRTVKAALEELFDHGRPTKVELAVLVDRGERRLPVAADYVGMNITASPEEKIVVALNPDNPRRDAIHVERIPVSSRRSPL